MGSIPIKVRSKKHSFIIKIIYLYLYISIKLQTKEQRAFRSPPKSTKTDLLQLVIGYWVFRGKDEQDNRMRHLCVSEFKHCVFQEIQDDNRMLCALDRQVLK